MGKKRRPVSSSSDVPESSESSPAESETSSSPEESSSADSSSSPEESSSGSPDSAESSQEESSDQKSSNVSSSEYSSTDSSPKTKSSKDKNTPKGEKTSKSDVDKERIAGARAAHKKGDKEASKRAHDASRKKELIRAEEDHQTVVGGYLKNIVYGGMDGIITTFAVVSSVTGARLSLEVVLVMGFSNLIADGISMGMGDFLSGKAELDYTWQERRRELWETENYLEGERAEMVEIMEEKGMSADDAEALINLYTKTDKEGQLVPNPAFTAQLYKDVFVDFMMVEELGLMTPDPDDKPWKDGLITFIAFMVFGLVPLLAYIALAATGQTKDNGTTAFVVSIILTLITMFGLGALTSKFTTQPVWLAGLLTLINGSIAAAAAFAIGYGLGDIFAEDLHCQA